MSFSAVGDCHFCFFVSFSAVGDCHYLLLLGIFVAVAVAADVAELLLVIACGFSSLFVIVKLLLAIVKFLLVIVKLSLFSAVGDCQIAVGGSAGVMVGDGCCWCQVVLCDLLLLLEVGGCLVFPSSSR